MGEAPCPGFAARCVVRAAKVASLATQAGGQPFASLVTPATAPDGSVLMLLSSLSAHTRHLECEPRCAILASGAPTGANPQTAPRVTVTGRAVREPDPAWHAWWVARHPYAAFYADFSDFALWRLVPEGGHYVGGFAQATVLPASAMAPPAAWVAVLRAAETRIVGHCNADRPEALTRLVRGIGLDGAWCMFGIDPDGIDLVQDGTVARVAFDGPVADEAAALAAVERLAWPPPGQ